MADAFKQYEAVGLPPGYEQWKFKDITQLACKTGEQLSIILKDSGFIPQYEIREVGFVEFYISDDKLHAVYYAYVSSTEDEGWTKCSIFVWRGNDGKLTADFGGCPEEKEFKSEFLGNDGIWNMFRYTCPGCGAENDEIGIPQRSQKVVRHECGTLFKQLLPVGMFGKPGLILVWKPTNKEISDGVVEANQKDSGV